MIRSRDFLIYMLILGFIILAATYTGLSSRVVNEMQYVLFAPSVSVEREVYSTHSVVDPEERMAELRSRLAAGEGYFDDAPPVFTSVDQTAQKAQATSSTTENYSGTRTVAWCNVPQPSPQAARWPLNTRLSEVEGQRVVTTQVTTEVQTGSTTETVISEETIVALPIRTVRSTFTSCLPDTLIGVTASGQPLLNEAAAQYANVPTNQPIGYTRDGFTVFGPVADESVLDECGGQYVGGQYQYHVRIAEPFIIACFAGVPASI
jgi:hypothetical protein